MPELPDVIRVDLSVAHTAPGQLFSVDADALTVVQADSDSTIRINSTTAEPIDLYNGIRISGGIDSIWIENEAASGVLMLVIERGICVRPSGGGGNDGGSFEGLFEAAPSTVADGETKQILIDENGRVIVVNEGTLSASEDTVGIASASPGTEGNAWDNELTGAAGDSSIITVTGGKIVSIFGTVDGATDLDVFFSQDGVNFYQSTHQISLAGAGDFGETIETAAAFVRLQSSADVTATVTVANKP